MLSALPLLRPLSLGELLDQAFRLYRRYFFIFIAIYAVVEIPLSVLEWLAVNFAPVASAPRASLVGLFSALVNIFIRTIYTAAITRAIASSYLGQPIGFRTAYQGIRPYWAGLIRVSLYNLLVNLALFLWMLVPCVGWFTGPGMLFYFAAIVVPLIAPALVMEGLGARQTVRRVWDLVRQRFWWVFGFALLTTLIQIAALGPSFMAGLALEALWPTLPAALQSQLLLRSALETLISTINTLLYQPFTSVMLVLVYFDLRVRLEGLDLALLAGSITGKAATEIVAHPSTPTHEKLFTSSEFGYFVLVSLAYAGLIALFISLAPVLGLFGNN